MPKTRKFWVTSSRIFPFQVHEVGSLNIQPTCELNRTFCLKFAINDPTQFKMLSTLIDIARGSGIFSRGTFCPQTKSELSWSVANELWWWGSQFVKCFRHRGSVLLLRKCDGQSGKKLCFFRSRCVRPGSLTREATHTAVSKQRCLAFSARDNHNWSKFAVPCQNNYWDLWPALSVLWSWRWEDSLRLGPIARLMADKYETASVLQCARNVAHNEEISRRYGPGSIARIIARLMAILP